MALRNRISLDRMHPALRPVAVAIAQPLASLPLHKADLARLLVADNHFQQGRYARALEHYRRVRFEPYRAVSRLMCDWINFKFGDYSHGWPEYPGKSIDADAATSAPSGPVHVRQPSRPVELVSELGLPLWQPGTDSDAPVLIWFNWKSSLGGEILAAKIVRAFLEKHALQGILAVDERLQSLVSGNVPNSTVIAKSADVAEFHGACSGYLMARDTLRHVLESEADFAAIASPPFHVEPSPPGNGDSAGRNIAFTWKTTNPEQGVYRNIPTGELIAIMQRHDVRFHSAQHGVTDTERAQFQSALGDRVRFDTIEPLGPVDVFAAQLKAMDALIPIDNSALHIAGACGIPTFGLLSVPSYWAWPLSGSNSRWYPSVRLIHQERPRQWQDVLEALSGQLEKMP